MQAQSGVQRPTGRNEDALTAAASSLDGKQLHILAALNAWLVRTGWVVGAASHAAILVQERLRNRIRIPILGGQDSSGSTLKYKMTTPKAMAG